MTGWALQTIGLAKRFGALVVSNDVSIALRPGARHALIGPNGAGKSTLVGLLSGTLRANDGRIILLGEDITDLAPAARTRRGLARTFQINSLFVNLTVIENLYLAITEQRRASFDFLRPAGRRRDILDAAEEMLEEFRLAPDANRKVAELAYGQQRLVEMAIALALRPKVLLLDEPAAGIPSGETRLLMEAIERLPDHMTILMIEHDMELVRRFAREVTVLVHGSVLLSGPLDEVMRSDEVRRVYLGTAGATLVGERIGA
ncbi:MAG TPA: ABC transporter ATP-binding protein [Bradyrhizobium sp.]|nr:ABC transporter ATP-binding protein [Bradyrhizobium sp.]